MNKIKFLIPAIALMLVIGCQAETKQEKYETINSADALATQKLDTATFAGGCFWCIEGSFEQIKGVASAVSGYAGGTKENATYKLTGTGRTKHAETVQIYFDPSVIDFNTLLDIFFVAHDARQLNRQGPDVGPQYRSAIFYHNEEQKQLIEAKIKQIEPDYGGKIVTEITPYTEFYMAEAYHQDYEKNNPYNPYVMSVSQPKIKKVRETFPDLIKKE
ncbi:MAG: peptide-methionine (S)-S-oxide reductase MsrA [Cyclobacteriaceae bacterium]